MNIVGVSFSYSDQSMGDRGLSLMDHYLNFSDIIHMDLPICNSNNPNGDVPIEVELFDHRLSVADILVFSIPEATGHYSAAFKNAMDWLVVKSNFNADLGQRYSISNKPTYIITFTPVHKNAGNRHFDMTRHLLRDKMGVDVRDMFVKNRGWENIIPNNCKFLHEECVQILNTKTVQPAISKEDMTVEVPIWNQQYSEWNLKWK
jgi:NAD(P)H-dependent FMN reductase